MTTVPSNYAVELVAASELSESALNACIAILRQGKAVDWRSASNELPVAAAIIVARNGLEIVGVGAIKRKRMEYAQRIAKKAKHEFPPETLELGYVTVDERHRNKGLSHRITSSLLAAYNGRLFATTYDKYMKRTLENAGFEKKGKQWKGRAHMLSYWERGADAPEK